MFIDDARRLVEGRAAVRQPLLEAWQATRLRFLEGGLDAAAMAAAQGALREADADPALLDQVQDALLSALDDPALEARLLALFHEVGTAQGDPVALARVDRLRAEGEAAWLAAGQGRPGAPQALELLSRSRLHEERTLAWEALAPVGTRLAEQALELGQRTAQVDQALGYEGALDRQGQWLGLDTGRGERWLAEVGGPLKPAIRHAATARAERLAAFHQVPATSLRLFHWGHTHPHGSPGRDGQALAGLDAALATADPLDLLTQLCDLLGWEGTPWMGSWRRGVRPLPGWLLGPLAGPEGKPPLVVWQGRGARACRRALAALGWCLSTQAGALRLAEEGEEPGSPWLWRPLQGAAAARLLADLPALPVVAPGLVESLEPGWQELWREQGLLELGRTLLALDWRSRPPQTVAGARERWVELRRAWLDLPTAAGDEDGWLRDPWLTWRPEAPLEDLAGRLLAAGLRRRWEDVAAPATPEWGGLWLEALTEPDDPDLWEAAGDRLLEALDPAALVALWGGVVGTGLAEGTRHPGRDTAQEPGADEMAGPS